MMEYGLHSIFLIMSIMIEIAMKMETEIRAMIAGMMICCMSCCNALSVFSQKENPFPIIVAIKTEIRQWIEAQKVSTTPANDNRMERKNDETWQGETPHGAALPP